jgi:hypothetical protein
MILRDCVRAMRARWRHPALWLGAFGLPAAIIAPLWMTPPPTLAAVLPFRPLTLVLGAFWAASLLLVALPVQWTGNARSQVGFFRGMAQFVALEIPLLVGAALSGRILVPPARMPIFAGMVVGFGFSALLYLAVLNWVVAKGETLEREVLEAETLAQTAERLLHRGSFSPRILFDSLTGFLDESDPRTLEAGLVDLAVLFRTRLVHQRLDMVPFREERALGDLTLKVLARGGWLPARVSTAWDAEAEGRTFPALGLVKVLETAASLRLQSGDLDLESRAVPGGLEVEVRWTGPEAPALAQALRGDPDLPRLSQRLEAYSSLRDPLSLDGDGQRCALVIRVVEGRP